MRVPEKRYEGDHRKGIEKQPVKSIPIAQIALEKIRYGHGYQGAMNGAVGNP
jgi:hypothetical protein